MKLGYTLIYVDDVVATMKFYEKAFGLKRGFLHESKRSIPDTWVTVYSGDIGNTFNLKGSSTGSILLPSLSKYPRS